MLAKRGMVPHWNTRVQTGHFHFPRPTNLRCGIGNAGCIARACLGGLLLLAACAPVHRQTRFAAEVAGAGGLADPNGILGPTKRLFASGTTIRHQSEGRMFQTAYTNWLWNEPSGHAPTSRFETGYAIGSQNPGWQFLGGITFHSSSSMRFFASLRVGDPDGWIEARAGRWNSFLDPRTEALCAGTHIGSVDIAIWGGRVVHFDDTSLNALLANRNMVQQLVVAPGVWQWGGGLDLFAPLTERVDALAQFVVAREPSATLGVRVTFGSSE